MKWTKPIPQLDFVDGIRVSNGSILNSAHEISSDGDECHMNGENGIDGQYMDSVYSCIGQFRSLQRLGVKEEMLMNAEKISAR